MARSIRLLLAALACATALPTLAAEPLPLRRVPLITGEMGVNVLVETDGTVKSWGSPQGDGTYLGDGTDGSRDAPGPLPGVSGIVDAAVAPGHALLLQRDGTVLTWGRNRSCELTVTDDRKRLTPFPVPGVHDAVQVAAGSMFSAAVLRDGSVMVWGSNEGGFLANGKSGWGEPCAIKPVMVEGLTGVRKIVIGNSVLALKTDGSVWGWGPNRNGELCDGTTEKRNRPVQMKGIANAVDIAIDHDSAIVLSDGTVWRCGTNTNAEMATKKTEPESIQHTTPVKIAGINSAVEVRSAGATIVRLKDGTLLGWGSGLFGGLGDGKVDKVTPNPHPPIGLGPVLAHFYASNSGYAIRADGTVMAWAIHDDKNDKWLTKPFPLFKVQLPN